MKIEIDKPVIPKFVADYLCRAKADVTLMRVLEIANTRNELLKWKKEYDWISANDETFARAWLDGYEVEKEPRYYAKIKGWELSTSKSSFWNYNHVSERPALSELYISSNKSFGSFKTKMTIEEWNKLGINDTNADFEVVSE